MSEPDTSRTAGLEPDQEERQIGELLRAAGARPLPRAEARDAIRARVQAEWQVTVERQRRQSRQTVWRVAAALLVTAGLTAWLLNSPRDNEPLAVATVSVVSGLVETGNGVDWSGTSSRQRLQTGDQLRTGPGGRAMLTLNDGVVVRVAGDTQLAWISPDRLELKRGASYVDTGQTAGEAGELVVQTRFGDIRHLGTQFLAKVMAGGLQVAVREGSVEVRRDNQTVQADRGEQLLLQPAQDVVRMPLETWGESWSWVEAIPAHYDIDGRTVSEFLAWAARETGRELRFDSPAVETESREVRLRGDYGALPANSALAAVMPTTRLDYQVTADGVLKVTFRD